MIRDLRSNQEQEERTSAKRKASSSELSGQPLPVPVGVSPKDDSPTTRRKVIPPNTQSSKKTSPVISELKKMEEMLANEELPRVVCSKSCLQLRAVSIKNAKGEVVEVQWRVVVEHVSNPDHCLDADIGRVLPNCQGCCWETFGPQVKVYDLSIAESALILRQEYFTTRRSGQEYFPKTICVSGRTYSLHRCQCESTYCYAVPFHDGDLDFVFAAKVGSDARYLIKIAKAAPLYGYRYDRAFEPSVDLMLGEQIVPTKYGEVYRAALRTRLLGAPEYSANVYDNLCCSEVAAKIVRHLNDHCGEVETVFCEKVIGAEKRYNRAPVHHLGSAGLEEDLTTAHLSAFFEKQHREFGSNEDVAREIEMMDFVHSEARAGLSRLLVPLTDFAICPNNLYVISPYMPMKSLFHYKLRDGLNGRISEECAKHVAFQLLSALVHLHSLRIAHRDISIENVVFGAAREKLQGLLEQLQNEDRMLSDTDFRQLEVKLIDLGQAVRHAANISMPLNASFDTVTTTESSGSCSEVDLPSLSPVKPATSTSCTSAECPEEVPPPPVVSPALTVPASSLPPTIASTALCRDYQLLRLGKHAVGKATSMCPEHYFPASLEYCGLCVDMWQMGMLIMCMVTGRPPYPVPREPSPQAFVDQQEWMRCVREGTLADRDVAVRISPELKVNYPLRLHVSAECLDLLTQLLRADPEARLTAAQALQHEWFQSYLQDVAADAQMK